MCFLGKIPLGVDINISDLTDLMPAVIDIMEKGKLNKTT